MVFTRIPPNGAMGDGPRVARGGREPDGLRAHRAACAPERPVPRRLVGRECRQDPRRGPEGDHGRGRTATGVSARAATVATSLGTLPTSRKRKALWPSKYSATPPAHGDRRDLPERAPDVGEGLLDAERHQHHAGGHRQVQKPHHEAYSPKCLESVVLRTSA
jgi:hypothetical protein